MYPHMASCTAEFSSYVSSNLLCVIRTITNHIQAEVIRDVSVWTVITTTNAIWRLFTFFLLFWRHLQVFGMEPTYLLTDLETKCNCSLIKQLTS